MTNLKFSEASISWESAFIQAAYTHDFHSLWALCKQQQADYKFLLQQYDILTQKHDKLRQKYSNKDKAYRQLKKTLGQLQLSLERSEEANFRLKISSRKNGLKKIQKVTEVTQVYQNYSFSKVHVKAESIGIQSQPYYEEKILKYQAQLSQLKLKLENFSSQYRNLSIQNSVLTYMLQQRDQQEEEAENDSFEQDSEYSVYYSEEQEELSQEEVQAESQESKQSEDNDIGEF